MHVKCHQQQSHKSGFYTVRVRVYTVMWYKCDCKKQHMLYNISHHEVFPTSIVCAAIRRAKALGIPILTAPSASASANTYTCETEQSHDTPSETLQNHGNTRTSVQEDQELISGYSHRLVYIRIICEPDQTLMRLTPNQGFL